MLRMFTFKNRRHLTSFLPEMLVFHLFLLSVFLVLRESKAEENSTLVLVQTLFRHGDRAPLFLYPTDPNSAACWPDGLKELTQRGKRQQYHLGKYLRSMYKDFITTNPREVYVNSSSVDRCLNSAESNMASFYAPDGIWRLEEGLDWQPIPIHYLPTDLDRTNFEKPCPRADREVLRQMNSPKVQSVYQAHQNMVEEVSNYSGLNYSNGFNSFNLFDTLQTEQKHNLTIPEWALYYWDEMGFIAYDVIFPTYYSSFIQLRLRIGPFLQILTKNLMNKINGTTPDLKVIMTSDHDVNVAGVLLALNFTHMPRPPLCSTLLFELHRMADSSMAVRLLYLNSTDPLRDIGEPHLLVMDGCSEFCPVEHFINSYQTLIPDDWDEECQLDASDTSGSSETSDSSDTSDSSSISDSSDASDTSDSSETSDSKDTYNV